jgi:asparagine synthase (glutamine-hydrolysing)
MCGIFFTNNCSTNKAGILVAFNSLAHRGPDGAQILMRRIKSADHFYGFHRLSIINPSAGINQPFQKKNVIVLCNGEIYNWRDLAKLFDIDIVSDCELIIHLYFKFNRDFTKLVQWLDGEFAIILHDIDCDIVYAARDFMGIRPLYYGYSYAPEVYRTSLGAAYDLVGNNTTSVIADDPIPILTISSELRALGSEDVAHILPRHIYMFKNNARIMEVHVYWEFPTLTTTKRPSQVEQDGTVEPYGNIDTCGKIAHPDRHLPDLGKIYQDLYGALYESVEARVSADRPIGCLLSGGLDSSIIAAISSKLCRRIRCFVIGAEDSPDVIAARKVAAYLKVPLQVVPFNIAEALANIPRVINSLETYDITTVRASTPQWHLARWISENTDIKVILSGEGSDELFMNGYAYTKLYEDAHELWEEGECLMSELYLFDCLRTDRAMAAWGLEVRVPFLQKYLVEYTRQLDPELFLYSRVPYAELDRSIEKALLRNMAARYALLPPEIIWRPKEAFSDAVGYSWKDTIQQHVAGLQCIERIHLTPISAEAEWYRAEFDRQFSGQSEILPHYWLPKKFATSDPSARVLPTYHTAMDITTNATNLDIL